MPEKPHAKRAARARSAGAAGPAAPIATVAPATQPRAAPRTPRTTAPIPDGVTRIGADERIQLIAAAAYFRAERRGFAGGSPEQDWLEAEAEVDRTLQASA